MPPPITIPPLIDTGSDDYYVSSMNRLVNQKFNYSKLILRKDFFRHLWDDAGLWPAEEPVDGRACRRPRTPGNPMTPKEGFP